MFSLTKMNDNIYHLSFDNFFDLGMTFLRYQEYYESPRFHDKNFTIAEFMHWYTKNSKKKSFTYTEDWAGYNIPIEKIEECFDNITDWNHHDFLMNGIIGLIRSDCVSGGYLIGTGTGKRQEEVLKHEFAHALFSVDLKYKLSITNIENTIRPEIWKKIYKILEKMGYAEHVFLDETQAFCVSGKEIFRSVSKDSGFKKFSSVVVKEFNSRYNK